MIFRVIQRKLRRIGLKILVSDLKEKEQVAASKPSSSSSPYAKVGNPFSKVGEVVVSDSDDEEDVMVELMNTIENFHFDVDGEMINNVFFDETNFQLEC